MPIRNDKVPTPYLVKVILIIIVLLLLITSMSNGIGYFVLAMLSYLFSLISYPVVFIIITGIIIFAIRRSYRTPVKPVQPSADVKGGVYSGDKNVYTAKSIGRAIVDFIFWAIVIFVIILLLLFGSCLLMFNGSSL